MIEGSTSYFIGVKGGLLMSTIAFSIVFIVILGLTFLMMAMKHICGGIDRIANNGNKEVLDNKEKNNAALVVKKEIDEKELVAVITAAISVMCGKAVKVLSFAPISAPKASTWRVMHKVSNIEDFLN